MNMTKDEFARWIAEKLLDIKNYNFDVLYDISKIMNLFYSRSVNLENPDYKEIHLMIRDNGSDLAEPSDENYLIYIGRNTKIYKLTFCFNNDYFHNIPFCQLEELQKPSKNQKSSHTSHETL